MTDTAFRAQLEGFALTTAEILYRLPDHPKLLQSYLWQDYDLVPRFPKLTDFLGFWSTNLDGALYRCLLYTSPSPRDRQRSRMPSSA